MTIERVTPSMIRPEAPKPATGDPSPSSPTGDPKPAPDVGPSRPEQK